MSTASLHFLTRLSTFLFTQTIPDPLPIPLNIYLLMKIAFRINRNLGNARARRRDNGNNILFTTSSCAIIAPRGLYNPCGSLTLIFWRIFGLRNLSRTPASTSIWYLARCWAPKHSHDLRLTSIIWNLNVNLWKLRDNWRILNEH